MTSKVLPPRNNNATLGEQALTSQGWCHKADVTSPAHSATGMRTCVALQELPPLLDYIIRIVSLQTILKKKKCLTWQLVKCHRGQSVVAASCLWHTHTNTPLTEVWPLKVDGSKQYSSRSVATQDVFTCHRTTNKDCLASWHIEIFIKNEEVEHSFCANIRGPRHFWKIRGLHQSSRRQLSYIYIYSHIHINLPTNLSLESLSGSVPCTIEDFFFLFYLPERSVDEGSVDPKDRGRVPHLPGQFLNHV